MKYLYMIFRLFKCPHKFEMVEKYERSKVRTGQIIAYTYVLKCKRCGIRKNHTVSWYG